MHLIEIPLIQHNDKYQQENYFYTNKQNDSFNNFAAFRYINTKRPSLDDATYACFHQQTLQPFYVSTSLLLKGSKKISIDTARKSTLKLGNLPSLKVIRPQRVRILHNKVNFKDVCNRPFYRYGGHIELIRFKEHYRMPRVMSTFHLYF